MNIMIAASGLGPSFASSSVNVDGALFVVVFSGLGILLLTIAGCLLRGCETRRVSLSRYIGVHR